jgi:hypothetical protein
MADIRINWEPPIDKSIVDSVSIYRYAGETSDCNIILSEGVLVVENLAADSDNYDDLGIVDSNHYSYGVFSKNVTGFSPCAHASLSLVPTVDGAPTDLTAVYVPAAPVEGPTNIIPTLEVAPKYGIDTGIFVYPLFITEAESRYYDSQNGGTGTSHTMTYNSVTYYMPDNGSTHAGTVAPVGVTINGNEFNYAQIVTGFEDGHKPTINEGPTNLTSTEQTVAPTNGPTDLTSTEQTEAPTNGPTSLTLKVDMDGDGFYADVDLDDNDNSVNVAPDANSAPTDLTSTEQTTAPASGPSDLGTTVSPNEAPSALGTTASPNEAPSALGTTASPNEAPSNVSTIANPNEAPTSLTSAEEVVAPTSGPSSLSVIRSPGGQGGASFSSDLYPTGGSTINGFYQYYTGPGALEITATTATWDGPQGMGMVIWSQSNGDNLATTNNFLTGWNITVGNYSYGAYQDVTISYTDTSLEAPSGLTSVEEILAPTSGPTDLSTLLDADGDGYYADVDLDDNDEDTGLYPPNVDITYNGRDSTYAEIFISNTPELYYVQGYSYIRRNGDSPMHLQDNYTATMYIRQGQTVTFTNNTTDMFYVRKQTDLSVNLLSIMGINAPSNTGTYTFNELGEYGWRTTSSGMVNLRFTVVPATAPLDSFQILDQGAAAGQSFAGNYRWDYYENNPSSLGWLQGIAQHGNTNFTIPSGYSTTHATILYRNTGTVWSYTGSGDGLIRFESLSNGQDTKNYLYATFGQSVSTQQILIYEITDQRPYTLGEVLPGWFINELAAEGYHITTALN